MSAQPLWREVLLATLWRISRPSELHDLLEVIRTRIDETPAGLRARQILAEVTFGPYDLPPTDIKRSAAEIIAVIETHPYGPHRARLLDSVLDRIGGTSNRRDRSEVPGSLDVARPRAIQPNRLANRSDTVSQWLVGEYLQTTRASAA